MSAQITLNWKKDSTFETMLNGHKLTIDNSIENGSNDEGPRPKALMLVSLAGCSAMDVAPLFRKMRVEANSLAIDVTAGTSDTIPMVYTSFHVTYRVEGNAAHASKIEKAIRLSQQKYCGVSFMLEKIAPITYEIILNGEPLEVHRNDKINEESLLQG